MSNTVYHSVTILVSGATTSLVPPELNETESQAHAPYIMESVGYQPCG